MEEGEVAEEGVGQRNKGIEAWKGVEDVRGGDELWKLKNSFCWWTLLIVIVVFEIFQEVLQEDQVKWDSSSTTSFPWNNLLTIVKWTMENYYNNPLAFRKWSFIIPVKLVWEGMLRILGTESQVLPEHEPITRPVCKPCNTLDTLYPGGHVGIHGILINDYEVVV